MHLSYADDNVILWTSKNEVENSAKRLLNASHNIMCKHNYF